MELRGMNGASAGLIFSHLELDELEKCFRELIIRV